MCRNCDFLNGEYQRMCQMYYSFQISEEEKDQWYEDFCRRWRQSQCHHSVSRQSANVCIEEKIEEPIPQRKNRGGLILAWNEGNPTIGFPDTNDYIQFLNNGNIVYSDPDLIRLISGLEGLNGVIRFMRDRGFEI